MKFIDPKKMTVDDLPLIVFSDHSSGVVQSLIKIWTKGTYNHVMVMHRPGYFASQGNMFSQTKISRYMGRRNRLKFYSIAGMTIKEKTEWLSKIDKELEEPWFKRFYDYLGILGQILRIKKIQSPRGFYCSERVADDLIKIFNFNLARHPHPDELNIALTATKRANVFGYWQGD